MKKVCPLCNDLKEITVFCRCGLQMEDAGPVNDYYGPYSPYFAAGPPSPSCLHLFTCPGCGEDRCVEINL